MNIYILRHGLAGKHGDPYYAKDSDRPLTPKGERKLWRITEAMDEMELSFDLILSSPYVRARQTALIAVEAFKAKRKFELTATLTPDASFRGLIELLTQRKPQPEDVLLVGHEPYLSELISLLVAGDSSLCLVMKKGGLCKISTDNLKHGRCASLEWLLTPSQMGLMA